MRSKTWLPALAVVVVVLSTGCFTVAWSQVAYTPTPARVEGPRDVVLALLGADRMAQCQYQDTFEGAELRHRVQCDGGEPEVVVLKTDKLAGVRLETAFGLFRATFKHADGSANFIFGSKNQADVERFIDAAAALAPAPLKVE